MLPLLTTSYNPNCSPSAAFFGMMGVTSALVLPLLGSAYGIAKSGSGVMHLGILNLKLVLRGILPTIMAEVFGIYGFVISMINAAQIIYNTNTGYSNVKGFDHMTSGFCVGLPCIAAGMCVGVVGDAGVRAYAKQPKIYITLILVIIFAEALGLYGLISALMIANLRNAPDCKPICDNNVCYPDY